MKGYLGEIKYVALKELPKGWLWCYGQFLKQEDYPELNKIINCDRFKAGLFCIPNLSKMSDIYKYMICVKGENPYGEQEGE